MQTVSHETKEFTIPSTYTCNISKFSFVVSMYFDILTNEFAAFWTTVGRFVTVVATVINCITGETGIYALVVITLEMFSTALIFLVIYKTK